MMYGKIIFGVHLPMFSVSHSTELALIAIALSYLRFQFFIEIKVVRLLRDTTLPIWVVLASQYIIAVIGIVLPRHSFLVMFAKLFGSFWTKYFFPSMTFLHFKVVLPDSFAMLLQQFFVRLYDGTHFLSVFWCSVVRWPSALPKSIMFIIAKMMLGTPNTRWKSLKLLVTPFTLNNYHFLHKNNSPLQPVARLLSRNQAAARGPMEMIPSLI